VIILDTNVMSELMRPAPSPAIARTLANYSAEELYTTCVTLAEVLYGIEILPSGRRKRELVAGAERLFKFVFNNRSLPFDEPAAERYSQIAADRRKLGRPISEFDAQIAAIAAVHDATLVTRNTADFANCGVRLINPWE